MCFVQRFASANLVCNITRKTEMSLRYQHPQDNLYGFLLINNCHSCYPGCTRLWWWALLLTRWSETTWSNVRGQADSLSRVREQGRYIRRRYRAASWNETTGMYSHWNSLITAVQHALCALHVYTTVYGQDDHLFRHVFCLCLVINGDSVSEALIFDQLQIGNSLWLSKH